MLPKFLCFGGVKMLEIQMNQAHLMFSLICSDLLSRAVAPSVNLRDFVRDLFTIECIGTFG